MKKYHLMNIKKGMNIKMMNIKNLMNIKQYTANDTYEKEE